ncbi:bacterial alpha-L-rhamnosidase-domain-containing protein [Immersiella caudata]|uniref:alpha-L-rhamnosidase n=1 Tax=Immersiella caudata TaxID=314043 RepID=A0AA39WFK0_9PEZI|nr:bacterial alpha-L-rhamnosidase-domain-containing protein [Immersiella caudata]
MTGPTTPLGLDNPRPSLSWRMLQTRDCVEPLCPADRQSAFQIQAAVTVVDLEAGRLSWDSGRVDGKQQQARFGYDLRSRDTIAWRVRIWDALGNPSCWSKPSTWTVGLLRQEDWGDARWIDYPDGAEKQPLPLFARQFVIPSDKEVANATLYLSGVGMHHATVNGEQITDEVLAPGYSNYQLSSEYRTYDVKKLLRPGANAIGVSLGNGPAYLSAVVGYHVGGTINIDTGGAGDNLESRTIIAISSTTRSITFTPGLLLAHAAGARVTGSGNNIAASDASAGAAVTPRLIGRLEIGYSDGSASVIVTDRAWRATLGPLVTDAWYSGSDYDARREQTLVTNPIPGTWVFDFGQNIVGWPLLELPELPAGVVVKMVPAESLAADGTVDQASLGPGPRGSHLFNTYTTAGRAGGETWHPKFNYFGMQWIEVTGLPAHVKPGLDLITGIRLQASVPVAGTFTSSDDRLNRIHKMARYSFAGNIMSTFTDCPGREKLSYPADYTMPMGRHLPQLPSRRLPSHHHAAFGRSGRFGDEINWGNAIVLVPSLLHDLYGDTTVMAACYDQMVAFVDYIRREKVQGHIMNAALANWVEDDGMTSAMARMANLTGHTVDAGRYTSLASEIRDAFHAAFYDDASRRYTNTGNTGTSNATQAAQALALDAWIVPDGLRKQVLDALVELTYSYPSSDELGPHLTRGTISLGPIVRALSEGGRDDVLWEALRQNDKPSYGYLMAPTSANPGGFTTVGETWRRSESKNHMILAQIDEWFHAGVAGLRPIALGTLSTTWGHGLVFQPKPAGDLESAAATYQTRWGEARSEWKRTGGGLFVLTVTVPANTEAEVHVPAASAVQAQGRAKLASTTKHGYAIYIVPSGTHSFRTTIA